MRRHDPIKVDLPTNRHWLRTVAIGLVLVGVIVLSVFEPWRKPPDPFPKLGIQMDVGDCMVLAWTAGNQTMWSFCCLQDYNDDIPLMMCEMRKVTGAPIQSLESKPSRPDPIKI